MNENRELISHLQRTASTVLDALIPQGTKVALLDYPGYSNVGDCLIWVGQVTYLRSRRISPVYVCQPTDYNISRLEKALGGGRSLILLQGGGNFGTLWPELQAFRERVLMDFPGVRVVQFPQSLYFESVDKLKRTAEIIRKHGSFTLLTRDKPSYELAREYFECDVHLCPDMAFFIGPLASTRMPPYDRFVLSRSDIEKAHDWQERLIALSEGVSVSTDDWLECGMHEKVLQRIQRHTDFLRRPLDQDNRLVLHLWNALAKARMMRGISLLERGRVVVSDRLHTHILSVLLNKPHVLLDNSYGKLSSFYHEWTESFPRARLAKGVEDAILAADQLDMNSSGMAV